MTSWAIHEKWCQKLGISKIVCREVNKIIDRPPHDVVDNLLKMKWAREAFEAGKLTEEMFQFKEIYAQLTRDLAEITNKFGEEGIKATYNHIALDYIDELIRLGFKKKEILRKLTENDLTEYIPDYDEVFSDVSKVSKPSKQKIEHREKFEKLVKRGVKGMLIVANQSLPAPAGLVKLEGRIRKGESTNVKWGCNEDSARQGMIHRRISTRAELEDLIEEIKKQQKRCP